MESNQSVDVKTGWWLVRVTLVVGFVFTTTYLFLDRWYGRTNAICHSVNADGMVVLLGGGGDTMLYSNLF